MLVLVSTLEFFVICVSKDHWRVPYSLVGEEIMENAVRGVGVSWTTRPKDHISTAFVYPVLVRGSIPSIGQHVPHCSGIGKKLGVFLMF